ncbi:MAG: DUF4147 domain-containing protein, partial [Deltaproteobacteria bacterium]|nr:DUF4147 domain-containing protein [Deltaproteobacteria bacterium]
GSALLPCPVDGLTLSDKQTVTKMLLECGANIREINTIRKHLSLVKGGRLASLASPSTVVTLILSDVVGDEIDSIASGPTAPDITTYEDCLRIVERYGIRDSMPAASLKILEDGMRGELPETPKKDDPAFGLTHNTIIGNNALAMESAKAKAEQLGYRSLVLSDSIQGDAHEAAKNHASLARDILSTGRPLLRPVCVISGGETTVVVQGNGTGGRNQEFVLAAALEIEGLQPVVILSGGTDGTDGPTDAAGALADG